MASRGQGTGVGDPVFVSPTAVPRSQRKLSNAYCLITRRLIIRADSGTVVRHVTTWLHLASISLDISQSYLKRR